MKRMAEIALVVVLALLLSAFGCNGEPNYRVACREGEVLIGYVVFPYGEVVDGDIYVIYNGLRMKVEPEDKDCRLEIY